MSYEKYTRLFELNKLIKKLDDTKYENCHELTLDFSRLVNETHKETLKNIGCNLESGYNFLTMTLKNTLTDLCKYLNLWLDVQKSLHVNDKSNVSEEDWQIVEDLWKRLKEEQNANHQCERKHEVKNTFEYSKRIELMSYCMNRDYFKRLLRSSGRSDSYIKEICKSFSDYTNDYYNKLIEGIGCIDKKSDTMRYKYQISNDCTLYDIPKTFPKCEEHSPTFVENDNSKKNIICETNAEVGSAITESAGSLAEPNQRGGALDNLFETAGDPVESPEIPDGPVKLPEGDDYSADFGELHLQLSPTLPSTNNLPSKPIYYAGLSVSGVFFTSMVLYKV
ncbi:hypothetical protein PVMG_00015 [Plasmodium vivax Mauritania I]|uniref:VIR protein n=1 Tax=Plasmodium vivax Mauritania I TaxID=1035515 RepID=A0A0J9T823_PLAVI|nr:hypothetical protein PVMG_00015 [Plasmodium vivax Mauritania I]